MLSTLKPSEFVFLYFPWWNKKTNSSFKYEKLAFVKVKIYIYSLGGTIKKTVSLEQKLPRYKYPL